MIKYPVVFAMPDVVNETWLNLSNLKVADKNNCFEEVDATHASRSGKENFEQGQFGFLCH